MQRTSTARLVVAWWLAGALCLLACVRAQESRTLAAIIDDYEKRVVDLAAELEGHWERTRECTIECNSDTCSLSSCQSSFTSLAICDLAHIIGDCPCYGAVRDYFTSSISLPGSVSYYDDMGTGGAYNNIRAAVCASRHLESSLVALGVSHDPDAVYTGWYNGLMRQMPAVTQDSCNSYDPRVRPWYVAAVSGPKDVVLLLDVSGSMNDQGKLEYMKLAAIAVIDELTFVDYFTVISFSTAARIIVGDGLLRGSQENKEAAIKAVKNLRGDGQTNFEAGLDAAFDALTDLNHDSSACGHMVILFLTDGKPSLGIKNKDELVSLVANRNAELAASRQIDSGASVFTYAFGFGPGVDTEITHELSCENKGVFAHITDISEVNLRTQMSKFYEFYSTEIEREAGPVWVEPYEYFGGTAWGTTVSMAVFDRTTSPASVVAVVGVDLLLDEMMSVEPDYEIVLGQLVDNSLRCPTISVDECHLEAIRAEAPSLCGACANATELHPAACTTEHFPADPYCNTNLAGLSWEMRGCCQVNETCVPRFVSRSATVSTAWPLAVCFLSVFTASFIQ